MHKTETILASTFTFLLLIAIAPVAVFAHAGHGNEFQSGTEATSNPEGIKVDATTASQIGIKLQSVSRQFLDIGIKTTGQIETQPNQQAQVTAPIPGTVAKLLVKPGQRVKKGQAVAVISSLELIELRVESLDRLTEAKATLGEAEANLELARENLERQRQIAAAEIDEAETQLAVAQEEYDKDLALAIEGALARRQMLESKTKLAEAKTLLKRAFSRRDVLEAEAELKRAQTAVKAAKSRVQLSDTTYKTRLEQLSNSANEQGKVTVLAPISGTVAQWQVSLGESFEDAGGQLMTIVNNNQVWATANIYEKDLYKVKIGQKVRLEVSSLPNQTFTGQVSQIDPIVAGQTRVVPVRVRLDNPGGQLKPGMFAQLNILTDKTSVATLAIPQDALVDANGKQLVYVENGQNFYEPVELALGSSFGDLVEVKSGLFEGDQIVAEGGVMLYAQSLRGGSKADHHEHDHEHEQEGHNHQATSTNVNVASLPWWWVFPVGGVITAGAFMVGRRTASQSRPAPIEISDEPTNNNYHSTADVKANGQSNADGYLDSAIPNRFVNRQ
ncbi:MAG: efflux RND transporter periplasmic adaptor subunit [Moorea sp. SIO1F2]|uniref:efflux RND transporter periplasmic adaptor subunit n=1 Tax=Moorena sp. SIO1F2 TaxID=2607819 RepID=UPI0013BB237A|nr:efflux RND transporter periplasmic adaptor subunit [Moorena sp. SIO1F2]NET84548.1 efflux RND transporter periplasmic adaptor subunit [Moorena sp. SIO1F2]